MAVFTTPAAGPFLVECGDEGLYWKVEEESQIHVLTATKVRNDASFFHIMPNEDIEDDPYDFYIGWEKKGPGVTLITSSTGSLRRKKSTVNQTGKQAVLRYLQVDDGGHSSEVRE